VIDFMYPLPENIGRRMRTMNFVRFFRRLGTVDLLYFYNESERATGKDIFRREHYIEHPSCEGARETRWGQRVAGRVERVLRSRPWMITEWPPGKLREYLSVVDGGNYDIIFCRYILEADPLFRLGAAGRQRVILDYDDVFSESLYGFHAKTDTDGFSSLRSSLQRRFLARYEKRCLAFGTVLFTTRLDRDKVAGAGGNANAFVVPNVYPASADAGAHGNGHANRSTLLFIGALNYGPNVEGLKWFLETIFRPVQSEMTDLRLLVVGRKPTPEVIALCGPVPNVEVHPDVPDVKPFYERCGIMVAPILSAGGTRIKILEAGVAGVPVLSTPIGAYGLDATSGRELFLFEDRRTFLDGFVRLGDKAVYDSVADNMRSLVRNRFSPETFGRTMEEVVRRLT
jgi:glycosyltransferase involved in cell wall biosynthesis